MAEPELRRASDPRIVRKVHFAIKKTCEQKQCPTFERIYRALSIDKIQVTRSRVEMQLNNAVRDGVISESNIPGNRGKSLVNEVKNSYRVPTLENFYENYEDDGHDWYCWVCHREGDVYLCSRCPRVIHKKCAELTSEDLVGEFVCYCCKDLESTKNYGKKELQELSTMLGFTVNRMKSKCEELWISPSEEDEPTYKLFIYKDSNLNNLEKRVRDKEFDSLAKFHYEIEWLFHNAVIFYGGDNKLTTLARMVVLDGQSELSQIDICSECYINSNKRPKNWFSKPCKPPHQIVFAKLGSDPPWPAKVLREHESNGSVDVRFFGQPYQRAWIPVRNIWDLDNKPPLKKRTKAFTMAEEELKIYMRYLSSDKNSETESQLSEDTKSELDDLEDEEEIREDEISDSKDEDELYDPPPAFKKQKPKKQNTPKNNNNNNNSKNKKSSGRGRPRKSDMDERDKDKSKPRKLKAEKRFRELQETKLEELSKDCKVSKHKRKSTSSSESSTDSVSKVDINKTIGDDTMSPDTQFAQQIKMTDDYKMIEKLQERVQKLEKTLEKTRSDYEIAQADLESTRIDFAGEKQKNKRLQEQNDSSSKGHEISLEKYKAELISKRQDDVEQAIEEERKRNELEFEVRLKEALNEERSQSEAKMQEALEKEHLQIDGQVKLMTQREKEEMQRNFERYKSEIEVKHNRSLDENTRKIKLESDDMIKRTMQRIHVDAERMVTATKKKSWCANCVKEAFYHCCWNTNYCSTECQRVHWVTHRYHCTREMMSSTCRSCQQRQNFPPANFGQVPPK